LILQELVTHSINELPLLSFASVLGAAVLAAGDKLCGTTRGTTCVVGGTTLIGSS